MNTQQKSLELAELMGWTVDSAKVTVFGEGIKPSFLCPDGAKVGSYADEM